MELTSTTSARSKTIGASSDGLCTGGKKYRRFNVIYIDIFQGVSFYIGRRRRTREVLQRHMYVSEITQWLQEAAELERNPTVNLVDETHISTRLMNSDA